MCMLNKTLLMSSYSFESSLAYALDRLLLRAACFTSLHSSQSAHFGHRCARLASTEGGVRLSLLHFEAVQEIVNSSSFKEVQSYGNLRWGGRAP